MKKILPFVIVFFIIPNVQAEEQKLSQAYEEQLIERVRSVFALGGPREVERPICATPIFVEVNFNKSRFSAKTAELLKSYVSRPDFGDDPEYTYDTPSAHFKIHYTTTGDHAVFRAGEDQNPPDGVPDYVNRCADIFDSVWIEEVDQLGYNRPPSDDWYEGNGGDGKYDVYVKNIDPLFLGFTNPETSTVANPISYTSYIVVRNDYSAYSGHEDRLDNLRATAAHEFFHAIHMGYDASEFEFDDPDDPNTYRPYWMEMSAVWMEEMVYDGVDDYLGYLSSFFNHPNWSLKTFGFSPDSARHAYGSCVWPMYLQERFDTTIIKHIWEECAKIPGNNAIDYPGGESATDKALKARGTTFEEAFREFTVWNYFTGDRVRPEVYYSEGEEFPQVMVEDLHYHGDTTTYPIFSPSGPNHPSNLGSNYVVFKYNPQLSEGGIRIEFYGFSGDFGVSVIGYKSYPLVPFETTLIGLAQIYDWSYYLEVVMIPAVLTRSPNDYWIYEYRVFYDSSLSGGPTTPERDRILQNFPNPFVVENEADRTFFPFILSSPSRVRIDIFTLNGERVKTITPKRDIILSSEEYVDEPVLQELRLFWDGTNEKGQYVSSGVYLYSFRTDRTTEVKQLAVIR